MEAKHLQNFLNNPRRSGLLQDFILPILFSLFLEDMETNFQENHTCGSTIDQINIFLIFFADDAAVTPHDLQKQLDKLDNYCKKNEDWN